MKEGKRAFEAKNYTLAESRFVSATKNAESDASHHEYQVVGLEALASIYCAESKTGELGRVFDHWVEANSKLSLDPHHRANAVLWDRRCARDLSERTMCDMLYEWRTRNLQELTRKERA
jgi:hypothetical protein